MLQLLLLGGSIFGYHLLKVKASKNLTSMSPEVRLKAMKDALEFVGTKVQ